MHTTKYIFAGIMTAIVGTAYATGENTVTSKSYVDSQDALKQNKIPATAVSDFDDELYVAKTLVSTTNTPGQVEQIGIVDTGMSAEEFNTSDFFQDTFGEYDQYLEMASLVPSMVSLELVSNAVYRDKQDKISKSGYNIAGSAYGNNDMSNGWLNADIKGTGLVTKTSTDGQVGERKIFEASDVSGYYAQGLTQNQKDIQDISIPTVGAMMSAISSGVSAATPTGTANTIANYGERGELGSGIATYTGAATYNATNDSAKVPTMAGVTTYAQAKKVCAGWPDGTTTYDAQHTDANCWLWRLPD